jgi:hypothetical protein
MSKTSEELANRAAALLRAESPERSQSIKAPWEQDPVKLLNLKINVEWLDVHIRQIESMRRVTKNDRRNLKAYLKVLQRLRAARSRIKHLDGVLLDMRLEDELIETTPFQSVLSVDDEIAIVKLMLDRSEGGKDKQALVATATAYALLQEFKIPAVVTRKSAWCRLAAILYGEPSKDFYHYVAEFRARPKPGLK